MRARAPTTDNNNDLFPRFSIRNAKNVMLQYVEVTLLQQGHSEAVHDGMSSVRTRRENWITESLLNLLDPVTSGKCWPSITVL